MGQKLLHSTNVKFAPPTLSQNQAREADIQALSYLTGSLDKKTGDYGELLSWWIMTYFPALEQSRGAREQARTAKCRANIGHILSQGR